MFHAKSSSQENQGCEYSFAKIVVRRESLWLKRSLRWEMVSVIRWEGPLFSWLKRSHYERQVVCLSSYLETIEQKVAIDVLRRLQRFQGIPQEQYFEGGSQVLTPESL
jgi:hypothetical protein